MQIASGLDKVNGIYIPGCLWTDSLFSVLEPLLILPLLWFAQPAGAAAAQVVHAQQRTVPAAAAPTEVVAIATGQGVRAVTPVTASAVVSSPVQSQTRSLVPQGTAPTPTFLNFDRINYHFYRY